MTEPRPLRAVLETTLYVDDLERARHFYGAVLGLEESAYRPPLFAFFRLERAMLLLFDPARASTSTSVPPHGANGPGHVAFAVADSALDDWRVRLEAAGVGIEQEASWPRGGRSLYFRDPAGNSLELAAPSIWGFDDGDVLPDVVHSPTMDR
ncbi:MAG: VOC family protein [Pseudomonadota bacterium]